MICRHLLNAHNVELRCQNYAKYCGICGNVLERKTTKELIVKINVIKA